MSADPSVPRRLHKDRGKRDSPRAMEEVPRMVRIRRHEKTKTDECIHSRRTGVSRKHTIQQAQTQDGKPRDSIRAGDHRGTVQHGRYDAVRIVAARKDETKMAKQLRISWGENKEKKTHSRRFLFPRQTGMGNKTGIIIIRDEGLSSFNTFFPERFVAEYNGETRSCTCIREAERQYLMMLRTSLREKLRNLDQFNLRKGK